MASRRARTADPHREGGVQLEPARLCDARTISTISRREIEHGLGWRWRPASVVAHIRAEDSCVVVARDDDRLVGFALMAFRFEEREAHLLLLAVVPSRRRAGLATGLVDWLETIARRGGIERLQLEVRETARAARSFYDRLGYQLVSRLPRYYQGREDGLRLEKRLA